MHASQEKSFKRGLQLSASFRIGMRAGDENHVTGIDQFVSYVQYLHFAFSHLDWFWRMHYKYDSPKSFFFTQGLFQWKRKRGERKKMFVSVSYRHFTSFSSSSFVACEQVWELYTWLVPYLMGNFIWRLKLWIAYFIISWLRNESGP